MIDACVMELGRRDYGEVWRLQQEMVAARQRDEIPDTLVLCEHPDVITLGRGARRENLVAPGDVPVFEIERGGDVTYHGPGQLVGYPIFRLRPSEQDLHQYLRTLEETLIAALSDFGIGARRRPGWTGVWTGAAGSDGPTDVGGKIASIGVAVKRQWVTMHGFALNVATDLARFAAINPCGLEASVMTSMARCLGRPLAVADVSRAVVVRAGDTFGRRFS